jgi:hypothetical protein
MAGKDAKNGNGKADIKVIYNAAVKAIKPYLGEKSEQTLGALDVGKQVDIAERAYRFLDAFKTCDKGTFDEDVYEAFQKVADKILLTLGDVDSRLEKRGMPAVITKAYNRIKEGELPNAVATEFEFEYQPKGPEAAATADADISYEKFMEDMDRMNAKNEELGERLAKVPPYDGAFYAAFDAKNAEIKSKVEGMRARDEARKAESAQSG